VNQFSFGIPIVWLHEKKIVDKQSYGNQFIRWQYNLQADWKKAELVVLFSTGRETPAFVVRLGTNVQRYGPPSFRGTDDGVGYP
jgi:hypothetical protein